MHIRTEHSRFDNANLYVVCRLYISPYDLSPTYSEVHNKFSVRYYLNLVLVDEEDRRSVRDRAGASGARGPISP